MSKAPITGPVISIKLFFMSFLRSNVEIEIDLLIIARLDVVLTFYRQLPCLFIKNKNVKDLKLFVD
jgi:hypothetical protein